MESLELREIAWYESLLDTRGCKHSQMESVFNALTDCHETLVAVDELGQVTLVKTKMPDYRKMQSHCRLIIKRVIESITHTSTEQHLTRVCEMLELIQLIPDTYWLIYKLNNALLVADATQLEACIELSNKAYHTLNTIDVIMTAPWVLGRTYRALKEIHRAHTALTKALIALE